MNTPSSPQQEPPELEVEVLPSEKNSGLSGDWMRVLAWIMDSLFRVPGTNFRFGLDPLIGLVPGVGDGAGATISSLLVLQAVQAGVPRITLARMVLNILINTVLNVIPGVGNLLSAAYKSNRRNYDLLLKHSGTPPAATRGDWIFVFTLLGGLFFVVLGLCILAAFLVFRILAWIASGFVF